MNTQSPIQVQSNGRLYRWVTVPSEKSLSKLLAHLIKLSCYFEVTPECDDRWTVQVKSDVAHVAFSPEVLASLASQEIGVAA